MLKKCMNKCVEREEERKRRKKILKIGEDGKSRWITRKGTGRDIRRVKKKG